MARIAINLKEGNVAQPNQDVIIGIDLGTTNSLVAWVKDGKPTVIKDKQDKYALVPSIIHFTPEGTTLTGDQARSKLIEDPSHTIYSVKRLMGKSYKDVQEFERHFGYQIIDEDSESLVKIRVHDRFYTPIELSAEILKTLRKRVEEELGAPVSRAVVTVPAYFNDAQRQATRDAGKLAGLDVLRIVNEPTAASLAYGLDSQEAQTIAVYDLGGGTFDISILRIQDGIFEVLSTNGDTFLGGDDFDRAIVEHWMKSNNIEPERLSVDKQLSQELRLLAETAKKQLSGEPLFSATLRSYDCQLSRVEFEELITPLVNKTLECCRLALRDANLGTSDIRHVVMVGGSTRVPLVKQAVSSFFQQAVYDKINPDEVVALGAAIQADVLAGNQKEVLLLDITPLSLGIETVGSLMDTILPRNTKIPARAGRQYTTSVDGQKNLRVAVYQGERDLVEHNRKLGEFILRNIPPMPAGLPKIEVQFIINADGILKVKASELRSGTEQAIEIRPTYGITEEQMALMLMDSIQNASSDMQARALLEARNEANYILQAADKFLSQNEGQLTAGEKEKTLALAADLRHAAGMDDKDAINRAIQALNDFTTPIAHRTMDHVIAAAMKGQKI
ncbi:MAG: hypothetical protein RI973_1484 [Bacteroidota bacterium]|jgi:molecular chaperone HscA